MKRISLLLGLLLGSLSYASTVTDNAVVEIEVFKAATLAVDDINFTKWMTGQTPGDKESNINITGGTPSATMTMSTPKTLQLSETGGATIEATMDFIGTGTDADTSTDSIHKITLGSSGEYTGKLKATIGTIPDDQVVGKYAGTAVIEITYN